MTDQLVGVARSGALPAITRKPSVRYIGLGIEGAWTPDGNTLGFATDPRLDNSNVIWSPQDRLAAIHFDMSSFPAIHASEYSGLRFMFQLSKLGNADHIHPVCLFDGKTVFVRGSGVSSSHDLDNEIEIVQGEALYMLAGFSWNGAPAAGVDYIFQLNAVSFGIANPHDEVTLHAAFVELIPQA